MALHPRFPASPYVELDPASNSCFSACANEGYAGVREITLTLHIQPGASRTEYAGLHGDAHKIRLAAPPVDGKANDALIAFLADAFGVRQRDVTIASGASSRRKIVRISGAVTRPPWAT